MAKEVTYEEIVRNLKNRIYAPVYFLMGEEDYYIDRIADYIIDTVLSETEKEFNLTVTYGVDTDVANVINAAKRYPMMSEYQVVVVKEAQSLKRIEELAFYLQKPQKSTILVVCYKHGSIDRRKKLAAEIEKNGVLFESRKLKDSQIPEAEESGNRAQGIGNDGRVCRSRPEPYGRRTGEAYPDTAGRRTPHHTGTD